MRIKDEAIIDSIADLGKDGIFCEPAGSTALAGVKKALSETLINPEDDVLIINTGNGLKDVRAAMMAVNDATIIEPTMAALRKHLKEKGSL